MQHNYEQERLEAVQAGERALSSLENARNKLNNAKNWGIAALLGGGMFTTMLKRSKMSDAQYYMDQAKQDLQKFRNELTDIDAAGYLNVQTGDFLTFADYFFDGFVADWLVQDKIHQARQQVDDAINRVRGILVQLDS